jgi:hypothetical protein
MHFTASLEQCSGHSAVMLGATPAFIAGPRHRPGLEVQTTILWIKAAAVSDI